MPGNFTTSPTNFLFSIIRTRQRVHVRRLLYKIIIKIISLNDNFSFERYKNEHAKYTHVYFTTKPRLIDFVLIGCIITPICQLMSTSVGRLISQFGHVALQTQSFLQSRERGRVAGRIQSGWPVILHRDSSLKPTTSCRR